MFEFIFWKALVSYLIFSKWFRYAGVFSFSLILSGMGFPIKYLLDITFNSYLHNI